MGTQGNVLLREQFDLLFRTDRTIHAQVGSDSVSIAVGFANLTRQKPGYHFANLTAGGL